MRDPYPVQGVPMDERYDDASQDRYADAVDFHKGGSGTYNYRPVTLEEEAWNGGWLPGARPTGGPGLQDLFTTGMRGEPGWDDDPQFNNGDPHLSHESKTAPNDISDID
jgi:hypothetical protein